MEDLLTELAAKEKLHNLRPFSDDYQTTAMWGQGKESTPIYDYTVTINDVTVRLSRMHCTWSENSGGSGSWNMRLIGFSVYCDKVLFATYNVKEQSLTWVHHSPEAEQHLSEAIRSLLDRIATCDAAADERRATEEAKGAARETAETAARDKHEAAVLDRFGIAA